MSNIGSPIDTSLLQAAQAQQVASKSRDKEKAAASDQSRRFADQVELRVAGLESAEALKKLPENDSEQAEAERHAKDQDHAPTQSDDDDRPRVDVRV